MRNWQFFTLIIIVLSISGIFFITFAEPEMKASITCYFYSLSSGVLLSEELRGVSIDYLTGPNGKCSNFSSLFN